MSSDDGTEIQIKGMMSTAPRRYVNAVSPGRLLIVLCARRHSTINAIVEKLEIAAAWREPRGERPALPHPGKRILRVAPRVGWRKESVSDRACRSAAVRICRLGERLTAGGQYSREKLHHRHHAGSCRIFTTRAAIPIACRQSCARMIKRHGWPEPRNRG